MGNSVCRYTSSETCTPIQIGNSCRELHACIRFFPTSRAACRVVYFILFTEWVKYFKCRCGPPHIRPSCRWTPQQGPGQLHSLRDKCAVCEVLQVHCYLQGLSGTMLFHQVCPQISIASCIDTVLCCNQSAANYDSFSSALYGPSVWSMYIRALCNVVQAW